jgi:hypothetical protein
MAAWLHGRAARLESSVRVPRLRTGGACVTPKWVSRPNGTGRTVRKTLGMLEAIDRWENEGGTVSPNDPVNDTSGLRPASGAWGSTLGLPGSEPVPLQSSSSSGPVRGTGVS